MADRVTVLGIDDRPLGGRAMAALARARLVVGAPRHVELVGHLVPPVTRVLGLDRDLPRMLRAVADAEGDCVVLAGGDPGFFGLARSLRAAHGQVEVIPAVSSVAAAFAAAGHSWDDALVVSAAGGSPQQVLAVCRRFPKVAVLTEPGLGPAELARALGSLPKRLVVGERLGRAGARVTAVSLEAAASGAWVDSDVVLVLEEPASASAPASAPARGPAWSAPPRWTPERWGLPDEAFERGGGTAIGAEVRAVALAWLGPGLGDLMWDVGTGSGAVAVEAARLGAAVIAVDDDRQQCARAEANAARHGVPIEVIEGRAPALLAGLPDPDAVFVGGGRHLVTEITRVAAERARRAVVVALAARARVAPVVRALEDAGLTVAGTELAATPILSRTAGQPREPIHLLRGGRDMPSRSPR